LQPRFSLNRVTDLKVFPQPQLGVLKKNRTTEKARKKKLTEKTESRKKTQKISGSVWGWVHTSELFKPNRTSSVCSSNQTTQGIKGLFSL
jgi:hypothetical protein